MEPMPCPKCGALLRIPADAPMIRCPSCQAVLALESDDEEVPLTPAPIRPAPLPFGKNARQAQEQDVPLVPAPRGIVRAKLADSPPLSSGRNPYEKDPKYDAIAHERKRREDIKRQLEELDAADRKTERRYKRYLTESQHGRTALKFFAGAALASGASGGMYFFFSLSLFLAEPIVPFLWLCGLALSLHFMCSLGGFGMACFGPKPVRTMAVFGLLTTLAQIALSCVTAIILLALISANRLGYQASSNSELIEQSLLLGNVFSNTSTLVDMPVYLLSGILDRPVILLWPILGGMLEFAKLSMLGIIANRYAAMGKALELSHQAMRFVYRIFGLVLIGVTFKMCLWFVFKFIGDQPLLMAWFAIPLMLSSNAYYMWWIFCWLAQYQTLKDIIDVVTADRFADARFQLDN